MRARWYPFIAVSVGCPLTGVGVDLAAARVAAINEGDCWRLDDGSRDCLKLSMVPDVARFVNLSFWGERS